MNQAKALLAKRAISGRVVGVGGSSKSSGFSDRETAVGEKGVGDAVDLGDGGQRVSKRSHGDREDGSPRRVVARTVLDPDSFCPGKSLAISSCLKDAVSADLSGSSASLPLRIEIQSNERWTVGASIPFQVFQAFDLPQDISSYEGKSRDVVADRCLARGGRFLADLSHIVNKYRADGALVRDLAEARDGRLAAEEKTRVMEKREAECSTELGRVKAELESARNAMKSIDKELEKTKLQVAEIRKECEEQRDEVVRVKGANFLLEKAVDNLKLELEKSIEDVVNGIGAGYQSCYDRLKEAGVDLSGHSFADYCASLATDVNSNESGVPIEDGECPGKM